jgi:hypothetical protein
MTANDKGKGKFVESIESEEDEDFYVSDQELYESESENEDSSDNEESENEFVQDPKDEIADLFKEAEENGDRGDMVIGLRSGHSKRPFDQVTTTSGQSSSKKITRHPSPSKASPTKSSTKKSSPK